MRQVLTELPIRNAAELSSFESDMTNLTSGFSLKRCMAYCDFRMAVLRSHQTKELIHAKFFLVHNHFISVEDRVATLYRHIEDDHIDPRPYDERDIDDSEKLHQDPARKRIKCIN
jgi:hypothetical protein